ncbi:MAG TPA: hypothetical protein DCQ98_14150 [Planctomycetaceae bacterium]|nr:hypothetical protein [Planctomycetaceae bacterium]HRE99731.1 PDZ domain-containing protein [Pirellulaceae bacterium]
MKFLLIIAGLLFVCDERLGAPDLGPMGMPVGQGAPVTDRSLDAIPTAPEPKQTEVAPVPNADERVPIARDVPSDIAIEVTRGSRDETSARWWLGVSCMEAPEVLLGHLQIPSALLVGCVAPDSPASRADLRADDLLLTLDGRTIGGIDDLVTRVELAAGRPLTLELLRSGERLEVAIEPALRPRSTPLVVMVDPAGRPLDAEAARLLENLKRNRPTYDMQIVLVRPGVVVSRATVGREFAGGDGSVTTTVSSGEFEIREKGLRTGAAADERPRFLPLESVTVAGERILFFAGDPAQVEYRPSNERSEELAAREASFPRIRTVAAGAWMGDAPTPQPIDTTGEVFRLRARTEQLEQELRLMRSQIEALQRRLDATEN